MIVGPVAYGTMVRLVSDLKAEKIDDQDNGFVKPET